MILRAIVGLRISLGIAFQTKCSMQRLQAVIVPARRRLFGAGEKRWSPPFPIYEAGFDRTHGVADEFDQAAVEDAVALPQTVIRDHVAELPLAVAARRAEILRCRRIQAIRKRVEHLLQLLPSGDMEAPVRKIVAAHDGESAAAAATVVVHTVRLHFTKLRA